MSLKEIHQPHDKLLKVAFGNKLVVQDFLRNRLHPEVLEQVNLETLSIQHPSFIDKNLRERQADLIYAVDIKDSPGYIYFLVEGKSALPRGGHAQLQLLEYNTKLYRRHLNLHDTDKLPVIINFLIYSGNQPYCGAKSLAAAFQDPVLARRVFDQNSIIDLHSDSEETIRRDGLASLAEFILVQGKLRDFCQWIEENAEIVYMINQSPYGTEVVKYMLDREQHNPKVLLEKMTNLDPKKKEDMVTALQRMEQIGRQEGIETGRKEGIETGMERGRKEGIETGMERGRKEGIETGIERGQRKAIEQLQQQGFLTPSQAQQAIEKLLR